MAKPSDLFVGITDLFSIILPGACMTVVFLLVHKSLPSSALPDILKTAHTNEEYVAFFALAYLIGHGMDMIGATFWDWLYDHSYAKWKKRGSGSILFERARFLATPSMPNENRTYQWCRTWVIMKSPEASTEMERLQANSKFFHGLVTTFAITAGLSVRYCVPFHRPGAAACAALALVAFARYCDLRWKAVQQTYRFFIALQVDSRHNAAQ